MNKITVTTYREPIVPNSGHGGHRRMISLFAFADPTRSRRTRKPIECKLSVEEARALIRTLENACKED